MYFPRTLAVSVAAFILGGVAEGLLHRTPAVSASATPEFVVTLHRFHLKPDQLAEFDRWIAFAHAHHSETLATLEREHMYANLSSGVVGMIPRRFTERNCEALPVLR